VKPRRLLAALKPTRRAAWILGLWGFAALLIGLQYLLLEHVYAGERHHARFGGDFIIPSGRWRLWGIVTPMLLITAAMVCQYRWFRGRWRPLAFYGLAALIPAWFFAWVMSEVSGPHGFDSVSLADGRRFILAQELVLTDSVYGLYEPYGPLGIYWRGAGDLDYSEDGRFTSDPGLTLSADEKWLLVARGGVWTDCFRLSAARPIDCAVKPYPSWSDPGFEQDMRLRSGRIAALTGLKPPGYGPNP
jgi:hypothetical protein